MNNLSFTILKSYINILGYVAPELAAKKAQSIFFTPRKHAQKPWEITAQNTARTAVLDSGINCLVWGQGEPILLVHGWEGRASQMSVFLPFLSTKYMLIAINAPAHGDSEETRSNPNKFIKAIFEAQKHFGPLKAVIGHSMGGGSAVYAAIEGLKVEKIISIAGPSNFQHSVESFAALIGLRGKVLGHFMKQTEQEVQLNFSEIDMAARVDRIDKPILIVHDENDLEVPFLQGCRYKDKLINGEFFATQNLGHRKIMKSEIVLQKVTDFIG